MMRCGLAGEQEVPALLKHRLAHRLAGMEIVAEVDRVQSFVAGAVPLPMSAMVYWLLVPVRLSGNPSQQRRTTLSRLSSTSIPTLNQTQPAKNSRPVLFQAGVALRPHPRPLK